MSADADNKAIVRRLYEEVWNKRKLEIISEVISPSHALQAPNISGSSVGPEAYKRQILLFLAGYSDLRFSIEDMIAQQDKVVACWTFSGTPSGAYLGIPATNKKVSVDGMTIHHVAGGENLESYRQLGALGKMQQRGVVSL